MAQAYAGHQFGGFSPQLGDGRALLLGEVIDRHGRRRDIAFKGSGRTPFSRGGDGKAARRPDAARGADRRGHARAGHPHHARAGGGGHRRAGVARDGRCPAPCSPAWPPATCASAPSSIFAARGEPDKLRQLADYAIARHDPALAGTPEPLPRPAARRGRAPGGADRAVDERRLHPRRDEHRQHDDLRRDHRLRPLRLHGGLRPAARCSARIDHQGRYAYGNQPRIARWNLARLAEALLPLMAAADDEPPCERAVAQVTEVIDAFPALVRRALLRGQRAKLGLRARDDDASRHRAGRGLAGAAARAAGRLHAGLAAAGRRRRGRRRRRCARCSPTPRRRTPGWRAGASALRGRAAAPARERARADARGQPAG